MRMKTLAVILSLFSSLTFADIPDYMGPDRSTVPEVMMGNFIVASFKEYPALQTYGLATCVAVTLYDQVQQQGALLHVSAATNIQAAMELAIADMVTNGTSPENIQAQLHGGWDVSMGADEGLRYTSDLIVAGVLNFLSQQNIPVVQNSTLTTKTAVNQGAPAIINIELDLRNGAVYQYIQTVPYARGDISHPMPDIY